MVRTDRPDGDGASDEVSIDISSVLAWSESMGPLTKAAERIPDIAGVTDLGQMLTGPMFGAVPGATAFAERQDRLTRHAIQVIQELDKTWRRTRDATAAAAKAFQNDDEALADALTRIRTPDEEVR